MSMAVQRRRVARDAGLSVFFPAYNDSGTIASLVITALRTARRLTPDYEVIVVNDGSADGTADILDELARIYPQVRVVHHPQNRGYGGALRTGFADGHARARLLHRRRRAVRSGGDGAALAPHGRRRRSGERLQDQPLGSAASHRHRPHLPPHGQAAVRAQGARRRLRFPADAPLDLRHGAPREEQRRHLPGDDEEDPGRRLPHRRGAGAPLPSRLRQVAVLQLRAAVPHGHRRDEALARAGHPARAHGGRRSPLPAVPVGGTPRTVRDGRPSRVLPRPPRPRHRRPGLHRQQSGAPARRSRRRRAASSTR